MPPEASAREWLERARADLRVAKLVLADASFPDWPAGFHIQQAAEKALKAVLVARSVPPPRTHDLGLLAEVVAGGAPELGGWAEQLLPLGEFGVAQRYPGAPAPAADLRALADAVERLLAAAGAACGSTRDRAGHG